MSCEKYKTLINTNMWVFSTKEDELLGNPRVVYYCYGY